MYVSDVHDVTRHDVTHEVRCKLRTVNRWYIEDLCFGGCTYVLARVKA
jgi:hypothetical protein